MTVTPSYDNDTARGDDLRGLTRRQVTTAAAWAAPVIAVALATPLAAASADASDFSASASQGGAATAPQSGLYNNVWFGRGNFGLNGPATGPGDTTGVISVDITLPTGYVLWTSNGAGVPVPVSQVNTAGGTLTYQGHAWSYAYASATRTFSFQNEGITIANGSTSGTAYLTPFVLVGSGCSAVNPARYSTRTAVWGSAGNYVFP